MSPTGCISPRRRASPRVAEGFTPTARGAYRIYCSISISPPFPHAGGDARAPRTHVVQSCRPSLSAVRTPEPRRGFPALREGFSPHAQRRARAGGLRPGEPRGSPYRGRFFRKLLRDISRFRHQNARTPPSPLVGEGGRGMRGKSAPEYRTSLISPKNSTLESRGDEGQKRAGMQKTTDLSQEIYP